jgi:hypothetical protein
VDTNENKQDWFLNGLNDGVAYALESRDFINFQDMVNKALVLKTEEELWNKRERCNALDRKEAALDSVLVHHHKDLFSDLVTIVDSRECKLQVKDFRLHNGRFNTTTSSLLALHHHHLRETTLDRVPWHGDPVSTVGRMGISLTGVRRSS